MPLVNFGSLDHPKLVMKLETFCLTTFTQPNGQVNEVNEIHSILMSSIVIRPIEVLIYDVKHKVIYQVIPKRIQRVSGELLGNITRRKSR